MVPGVVVEDTEVAVVAVGGLDTNDVVEEGPEVSEVVLESSESLWAVLVGSEAADEVVDGAAVLEEEDVSLFSSRLSSSGTSNSTPVLKTE